MSIPGGANPLLLATAAVADAGPFSVTRSLRFDSSASSYLTRTASSAGNTKTLTISAWVKRGKFSTGNVGWISARTSGNGDFIRFSDESPNNIRIRGEGTHDLRTNAVFVDHGAFYHIVVAYDTTQSTQANRIKLYVNGEQITDFASATYPGQNADLRWNSTEPHEVGRIQGSTYFDGYLAEVQLIDGQALAPTDFAETDSDNNWNPKAFSGGSYGSNGFYLKFADNSSNSALGTDSSGNDNTFSVHNLTADGGVKYSGGVSGYLGSLNSSYNDTSKLFEDNTSTSSRVTSSSTSGHGIKFVPGTAISGTIGLHLRNGDTANSTFSYSLDGGSSFTNVTTSAGDGSLVNIGSQTIGTTHGIIVRHITTDGTNAVDWRKITVDGNALVDGSAFNTDCVIDVPLNSDADSGNNLGNYCVFNPVSADDSVYYTANGNLVTGNNSVSSSSSGSRGRILSSIGFKTGKWYAEVQTTAASDGDVDFAIGIFPVESTGYYSTSGHYALRPTGHLYSPDGIHQSYGTGSWTNDDIIGIAVDMDSSTKTIQFFKNGTAIASATTIVANEYFFGYGSDGGGGSRSFKSTWNFGAAPFTYSPPSGHKSLCTQNLTDPTIADGSTAMDVKLWTGTGSSRSITSYSFSPDIAWIKQRDATRSHNIFDIVRGASKPIFADLTNQQLSDGRLTSFDSTGFTLDSDNAVNDTNGSYVGYAWDAGTTTVTNNSDGSITPTGLRASTANGISIIKYIGTGSNATVGHGLNAAPEFFFGRNLEDTSGNRDWIVYHKALGANNRLKLNNANAESTSSVFFQNTHPTSSVISIGTSDDINKEDDDYVMYCFTPIPGFSAVGSFTNPSSSIGAFVYCGFRPAFIFAKCARNISSSSGSGDWIIKDTARSPFNNPSDGNTIAANVNNGEDNYYSATQAAVDILSNGFKIRHPNSSPLGDPGRLYVFFAIAEHPFKTARAR